jgi:hypothetical protein
VAFKTSQKPPRDWDHYMAAVARTLEILGVTGKSVMEVDRAARLAVVDTDSETRKNRRVNLRRALRPTRKGKK